MSIMRGGGANGRLGRNYTGTSDAELTALLRVIGDDSVVVGGTGNVQGERRTKSVMPCWSRDGFCVESGDDPSDGQVGDDCMYE